MTTDHQMVMMYATQQQVIVAVADVGKADLADPSGTLHDSTARPARRRWLAVHLPICCVRVVPTTNDPLVVAWLCQWTAEATTWSLAINDGHRDGGRIVRHGDPPDGH